MSLKQRLHETTDMQTCRDDCRCIAAVPSLLPQARHSRSAAELVLVPVLCTTHAATHSFSRLCCVTDDDTTRHVTHSLGGILCYLPLREQ